MADINDLRRSISEMSDEELFEFVRGVRSRRREIKPTKVSKPKVSKAQKLASSFCIEGLSQEAAQKILEMLGPLAQMSEDKGGIVDDAEGQMKEKFNLEEASDGELSEDDESSNGEDRGD